MSVSNQDIDIDALVRGQGRSRRWVMLLLAIVIVAVAIVAWLVTRDSEQEVVFEPQRITATRGQLTTTVELSGSASAAQTSTLSFGASGEVDSVNVEVGEEVIRGDALASLDSSNAERQLETAEVQLEIARLRLEELLEHAADSDIAASERALATAQAQVVSAALELEQIDDPPDASAIEAAEQSLASARNQLSAARQALSDLTDGVDPTQLARAQQDLANAVMQLSAAQEALEDLRNGPTSTQIANADRSVANAATQLSTAQEALKELTSEPTTAERAAAEQAVASAASQLASARQGLERLTTERSVAEIETARSAAVQARNPVTVAEQAVERAEDALERAHERFCDDIVVLPEICDAAPPLPQSEIDLLETKTENSGATVERRSRELIAAQESWEQAVNSYDAAVSTLIAAEARLDELDSDPDADELAQATESLAAAEAAHEAAKARHEDLLTPATEEDVFQAEQSVVAATAGLIAAESERQELREGADATDILQAEQAVRAAEAGLNAAESSLNELLGGVDPRDLYQAEQSVAAAEANRDSAESRLKELLEPPTAEDILEAELALASAESSLKEAQARYDELLAGADDTTIGQQEQNVRLAEIALEQAVAAMEDVVITAPFDGVIEAVNIELGDRIGGGAAAFVLSTRDQIVVDLTVTEAEIFDLEETQVGVASFDAIEGIQYPVRISTISRVPDVEQGVVTYVVEATVLSPLAIQAVRDDLQALGVTVPEPRPAGGQGGGEATAANPQQAARFRAWLESLDLPEGVTMIQVVQALANDEPLPEGVDLPEDFEITDEQRAQLRTLIARFSGGGGGAAGGQAAVDDDRQLPVDGMSATVVILTAVREEAVLISTSAVRQIDGAFYVATPTEEESGWERVAVQIGETDGTNVEILEGLAEGETVLVGVDSVGIAYSATQLPGGGAGGAGLGGAGGGGGPPRGGG
jgi:multidrug efflux pump subunit AcrA (membrane-fusion protein)